MSIEQMKIVKVEWIDAHTVHETISEEEIKEEINLDATVIGYLIDENKERIAVCGQVFYADFGGKENGFKDTHFIPKKSIKKITELKW